MVNGAGDRAVRAGISAKTPSRGAGDHGSETDDLIAEPAARASTELTVLRQKGFPQQGSGRSEPRAPLHGLGGAGASKDDA